MFIHPIIRFLAAGASAAMLASCVTDGNGNSAQSTSRVRAGVSIDSVMGAKAAVLVGKTLYVGNRDSVATGLVGINVDADTIVSFHAEKLPPNEMALVEDSLIVIAETDFVTGAMSLFNTKSGSLDASYKAVASDNALSGDGTKTFFMDRTLGAVTGFTHGKMETANVFFDLQTGASSDPYYVALSGDNAYVTRYNAKSLLIAQAGKLDGGTLDSVDLSAYVANSLKDSGNAVPNMANVVAYGNNLFVTVQRLSGWMANDTSKVIVIDAQTHAVQSVIDLKFRNPIAVTTLGKSMFVTGIGDYGVWDGGVERIDMETAALAGTVVEESSLEADVYNFVPASDTKGYVMFAKDFKATHIKAVTIP